VTSPQSDDPYQDVPTAVVYDEFAETATTLTGLYNSRSHAAVTEEERQAWWDKVIALRDTRRAVPAHDRDQLIAHITRWTQEIQSLESANRG
jgi:hypothetical protein